VPTEEPDLSSESVAWSDLAKKAKLKKKPTDIHALYIPSVQDPEKPTPILFRKIPKCPDGFPMGSRSLDAAQPVTRVIIDQDYWLAAFPITQLQWRKGVELFQHQKLPQAQQLNPQPSHHSGDYLPVEQVSWDDAQRWISMLSSIVQSESNALELRLPYEAEWEWACRAVQDGDRNYRACTWEFNGTSQFGDRDAAMDHNGWFGRNSGRATHRVGEKAPNPLGLYDMHGNVDEWCMDRWVDDYSQYWDGITIKELREVNAESSDGLRATRGGSWIYSAGRCQAADRYWGSPDFRYGVLGFRVGLFPGPNRANASKTQVGSKLRREAETQREPTESPRAGFESMSMPPRSGENF
jgi:formylglycine-generating enzyme required for sulfatase activity